MELETRPQHTATQEDLTRSSLLADSSSLDEQQHDLQLSPVDGGKDAWLFLAASFMIEALVWG
jgi:hypothetical protein